MAPMDSQQGWGGTPMHIYKKDRGELALEVRTGSELFGRAAVPRKSLRVEDSDVRSAAH